ncbi:minor capsid protein [Streptococcus suis]|uniref:minor capsid protein n=1 Tax=Streptococcus suis TaxID=1307 RepID=UPI00201ADA1D|nr:minor capsid protein [Streptococcus suis]MCL4935445.1 minor capsid protein [Streptococcus suis]
MDNQKYWEKRKAQRMVQAMDQAEQTAKQLDEIHKLASRHITSKIDQIFESYRRDHGLTEDEAARVLANVKDLSDIRELKLALQNTTDSEEIRQLLILLDSAPYASRIEKYEALQREVDNLPTRLYKVENEASRTFYDEFIPDAYYHSIFDLQQQSGVAFAFNRIDTEEIRAIQQTPWLGANYSERIWGNTQALANELQKQLAVSLLTGRSAHETAEVINAQFGKGSYNSRRLVRTEASHFHAEMEALAYEEAEVERYRLVAVLDLRTSSICREHDGEVYLVSERVKGKNYPPLHPWCRTVTIALDDDEWLAKATRSARDPETGKTIQVPANMTYKDWYEKYVDKAADLVENSAQKFYNQDMDDFQSSGAISERRGDVKKQQDEFAERYYNQLRNSKRDLVIDKIANSSGVDKATVENALAHILDNTYQLWDSEEFEYRDRNFYPHYDMAQSFQRLMLGKPRESDIIMLKHESLESHYMNEYNMAYDDAHKLANEKYNYQEADKHG